MNLPKSIDDSSLSQHEPLLSHCVMLRDTSRSESKQVLSSFVNAMHGDTQATAAALRWACLVFGDDLLEVTDGGKELFKVFFTYQCRLQDTEQGRASEYSVRVFKNGLHALKLQIAGAQAPPPHPQKSSRNRGRGKGQRGGSGASTGTKTVPGAISHQLEPAVGDICDTGTNVPTPETGLGSENKNQSMTDVVAGELDIALRTLTPESPMIPSEGAAQGRHSQSNKSKKRKATSQKPPVITSPDASEDDAQPSECCLAALEHPASSMSHQPKVQSTLVSSCPGGPIPRDVRSENVTRPKPKDTKRVENTHPQTSKPVTSLGRLCKTEAGNTDLPTHASKRPRQSAMLESATGLDPDQGPSFIQKDDSREPHISKHTKSLYPPTTQRDNGTAVIQSTPLVCQVVRHSFSDPVERPKSRKRPRAEFEARSMDSRVNPRSDANDPPGRFDTRDLRPLPLIRPQSMYSANTELAGCRPCYGVQSQDDADRLIRDAATNALVRLQDENRPDIPDWTQDEDHDAELDDSSVRDGDEANDTQPTPPDPSPSAIALKPPVPAPPLIWAQSRQEVCESFDLFRSYHSGVYSNKDIVKGYLLGAYAASRDLFYHGGKLIISHGGGKSESTLGSLRQEGAQDQEASDKSVRALLKTYKQCMPLVLLADDKYALFPYDLAASKYTYVVLGIYRIAHAWAECQPSSDGLKRIVRWKFAFQWCEGQGDPWWMIQQKTESSESNEPPTRFPLAGAEKFSDIEGNPGQCEHCHEESPTVYMQGWMCLNPRCDLFWSINGKEPQQLGYCEKFLQLVPQKFGNLPDIMPARAVQTPDRVTTTYSFSRGWHCTKCGRLSCRFKWEHWECSNCQERHVVEGRVRLAKEFWHQRPAGTFLHSQIGKNSGVLACCPEPIDLGSPKGFTNRLTFILPHGRGKIHLILGTSMANADADDTFQLYQQQASTGELKLRRYPLRNHRARGLLLTNYFSQNSGQAYQYVGGTGNTIPFDEAPDCIRRALALIKERSSLALGTGVPFNEILSAAYMERQKMAFHSDSEKGLGPIVASLSLGSAALMHFRQRVSAQDCQGPKPQCPTALTLVLRHGDVLIMEGDGVQKSYEHTVIPMNFRIAATARCIGST
ncbi:hypothetical protein PAXRUDRAFT_831057 [Paxillus rubicundulus Ve08.2h10]|uniref:Alpha-ketoglutarate-dependent dioxygenase AlkB-like domain-containing protein n=1 Tax=Paxillus rubicundulus Ve08.2h10 TaxID=930991 RepID=A0A0D0D3W3_9AGAM|nr:hypothetical protein PAXRUDRAFT_831057 [Paxillus rubicundulus Ve08.2h10]